MSLGGTLYLLVEESMSVRSRCCSKTPSLRDNDIDEHADVNTSRVLQGSQDSEHDLIRLF
jgi:hypothetical protein